MSEKPKVTKEQKDTSKTKPWWKRPLRILFRIFCVIFLILFLLILFIRSPWGQDLIVGEATKYVSKKTHTEISIDKLFITFSGNINLEGLYLEDQQGDTLVYSKKLQAAIPFIPIIKGTPIALNGLKWDGLRANVKQVDSTEGFNYQFLIDAFASDSTETTESSEAQETNTEESDIPKIIVGNIDFSDFKLKYEDVPGGMKASLDLGKFHIQGKDLDLNEMKFAVKDLSLEDTKILYEQTKSFPETEEDTTETPLPFVSVDNFKLKNVKVNYKSEPDSMAVSADIGDFLLQLPEADLALQNIEVGDLTLINSDIQFKSWIKKVTEENQEDNIKESQPTEEQEEIEFEWPDWNVKVKEIAFKNNDLLYQNGDKSEKQDKFNPDYIAITDFVFILKDFELSKDEAIKADLKEFNFTEGSGFDLKQLGFALDLNKSGLNIEDFKGETSNSTIAADIRLKYRSINDLINVPEESEFALDVGEFSIDLNDAFVFEPDLKTNEYLAKLSKQKITGKIKAAGSVKETDLSRFDLKWGDYTKIQTHGKFSDLLNTDKLKIAVDDFVFETQRSDVLALMNEEELGIKVPQTIRLNGKVSGMLNDLKVDAFLNIPEGQVILNGRYAEKANIDFAGDLEVKDFQLGKLLDNPQIGNIAFTMSTKGQGKTLDDLNAELTSDFSKLEFNGYDFSALNLTGHLENGNGNFDIDYKDDNLDLAIHNKLQLDSITQRVATDLNLNGADLNKLGLIDKKLRTKVLMSSNFANRDGNMDFDASVAQADAVYEGQTYHLGKVDLEGLIYKDSTGLDIKSDFLNGGLHSNDDPEAIAQAIERQFNRYIKDTVPPLDSGQKPIRLQMDMELTENALINNIFIPDVERMDPLNLSVNFDQEKDKLVADLTLPYLDYAGNIINDLYFNLNSTVDAGQFIFGFENLDAGAFGMNQTFWNGDLKDGAFTVNFFALDEQEDKFYSLHTETRGNSDEINFHILPYDLTFNNKDWTIPEENLLTISKDSISAKNFVLSREGQSIQIANNLMKVKHNNIGIGFKDFDLETILALFNPQDHLASGNLQGEIVAVTPFKKLGILANFGIDDLEVMQAPLGNLSLKAAARGLNQYRFKMDLLGNDVDLAVIGKYSTEKDSDIKIDADLKKFGFETISKLSENEVTDASGYLSGEFAVTGKAADPKYEGYLKFNDASVRIAQLNSVFNLTDDKIDIDNKGIHFTNFSIEDDNKNPLSIEGSILTKDFSDPEFKLTVNAQDFQLMNSTEKDNKEFYGKVNFDVNGTIGGRMSFPKVDLKIGVNKNTDFTYVYSESRAARQEQDGVVEFVNKDNPDDILTRNSDSLNIAKVTGMDLHANINIDKEAQFGVIVDPRTGDNLEIAGEGNLDFRINENGDMNLTGRYTIDKGHYDLSLYNLVKRDFEFRQGSTIVWQGDPMDADLDVSATYETKTSASSLMTSETGGGGQESNQYKQRLPFIVSLNVKGTIDKPELSFGLDMPEGSKGAIGGSVYGRVSQVNSNEGELNKQVFSLLVLNRFFPESGSDGGEGGMATMARNNLNDALSDQMNNFSDQLMGNTGIKLNFGLDSYTDYQGESTEERTDLNISAEKKLFDDRLVVKAGTDVNVQGDARPGEETPLVGNVSIEYLLTKDGRWRIEGFRKDEYENVIDGQVFVNGIGLTFQREFNRFSYLWRSFIGNPKSYYKKKRKEREEKRKEKVSDKDKSKATKEKSDESKIKDD